jgi:azurin
MAGSDGRNFPTAHRNLPANTRIQQEPSMNTAPFLVAAAIALTATAPAAATPPAGARPAAVVANCATQVEANDMMQFDVGSIAIPASCKTFRITLKHVGKLPVTAMGHDIVVARAADMAGIAADGMAAGAAANYLKPGDARVIAHTKLVGGGGSDSVSVPVAKLKAGGPFAFFCSFPGHSAAMKGSITVE